MCVSIWTTRTNSMQSPFYLKDQEISQRHIFVFRSSFRKWLDYFLQLCTDIKASGWDLNRKEHLYNRWLSTLNLIIGSDGKQLHSTVLKKTIFFLSSATLSFYSTMFERDIFYFFIPLHLFDHPFQKICNPALKYSVFVDWISSVIIYPFFRVENSCDCLLYAIVAIALNKHMISLEPVLLR